MRDGLSFLSNSRIQRIRVLCESLWEGSSIRVIFAVFVAITKLFELFQGQPQRLHFSGVTAAEKFRATHACHLLKMNLDNQSKQASGVTYLDAESCEVEQPADMVLLCAFSLFNM